MDEFAQSRADNDLFDDDIIPVEPCEDEAVESLSQDLRDVSLDSAPKGPAAGTHYHRGYGARGDRGRGRARDRARAQARGGRGEGLEIVNSGQQSSAVYESTHAPCSIESNHALGASAATAIPPILAQPSQGEGATTSTPKNGPEDKSVATPTPPTEPSTPARPPAVRGDRTATGGIKKPKLTEEELKAKLAAAEMRSQTLSAAHAKAEADAARFAEQERVAAENRIKDAANRKLMEDERERNRARKMAGMGGRKWDAAKNEDDFKVLSRGRARGNDAGGINGGVRVNLEQLPEDDLRQYQWNDGRGMARGQGRRRGGGRERGTPGRRSDSRYGAGPQPDVTAEADFPSLPASTKPKGNEPTAMKPEQNRSSSEILSATAGAGSWADQVEVSEATKPKGR